MVPVLITGILLLATHTIVQALTNSLGLSLSPTVIVGQEAVFNCSASGSGPDPTFTWAIKDNNGNTVSPSLTSITPVSDTDTTDGEALSQVKFIITSEHLSSTDPKRLWCHAIDSGNTSPSIQIFTFLTATEPSSGTTLNESFAITFENGVATPDRIDAVESTDVTVICYTGNSPLQSIGWTKMGDPSFGVDDATLTISNVKSASNGIYQCTATYNQEIGIKIFTLNVLYTPSEPVIHGPRSVEFKHPFSMQCTSDSNPPPTYKWTFDQNPSSGIVARGPTLNYTQDISIYELTVVCWAEVTLTPTRGQQEVHKVYKLTRVLMLEPAYIWELSDSTILVVGDNANIACNVAGRPVPTIWWTKDGDKNYYSEGKYLSLNNIKRGNAGVYTCNAENVLEISGRGPRTTTDKRNTTVNVHDPILPENCTEFCLPENICNITSTSSPQTTTKLNQSCESTCNNIMLIVAMAIGWLVAIILFVSLLFYCVCRRNRSANADESNPATAQPNITDIERHRSLPSVPYNPPDGLDLPTGENYIELDVREHPTPTGNTFDDDAYVYVKSSDSSNTYVKGDSDVTTVKETNDREGNPAGNSYLTPTNPAMASGYIHVQP